MGSKHRLLDWLHSVFAQLPFQTATDAFSGSGAVSYLFKAMGKAVTSNDALNFPAVLARATIGNSTETLSREDVAGILSASASAQFRFIETTFSGIFYTPADLRFLDDAWEGVRGLPSPAKRALALAALLRACIKRQPRGVFTVAGDLANYDDGRRDLQLSLREHFFEQVEAYNAAVFNNGQAHRVEQGDVFGAPTGSDLVYLDPPYVPRTDDNCYVKRYHFLEGLSCYWAGQELLGTSKVRKIRKPFTPFSYQRTAVDAFDRLFRRFADSTIVLSYSSNAFPELANLRRWLERYKPTVEVITRPHRYHFGTHENARRNEVEEYLLIGTG
jgi:DNA adenine methylase/adenine-specific DNA-methyltransferase